MAYTFYEPLSMVDAAFLAVEDHKAHMQIGGVSIFDAEALQRAGGGLDIDRIRAFVGAQLHRIPRFRQKLAFVPVLGRPVWVDDEKLNLVYHVRHTALPVPGDTRKLKDLAGRVLSQELDRGKPLWELWFVEGLERNRFAVVSKIHHALADGISGVDLVSAIVGPDPAYRSKPAPAWIPRRPPSGLEMLSSEVVRTVTTPLRMLGRAAPSLRRLRATVSEPARTAAPDLASPAPYAREAVREEHEPDEPAVAMRGAAAGGFRDTTAKVFAALGAALDAPDPTPLNVDVGPYRRFDWTRIDFAVLRAIRARYGGKVNDVVLAVVAGAVRKFLLRRGLKVRDLDFRVMVPVSVRARAERGELGNRVSQMLTRLPLDEVDPVARLGRMIEITASLKSSGQAEGGQAMTMLAEVLGTPLATRVARVAARHSFGNMVVTNVPGPARPTYLMGAPTLEAYPVVPLAPTQALNIAVLSYNEVLHWGFNADWDAVPDLADFVALVDEEAAALHAAAEPLQIAAGVAPKPRPRPPAARAEAPRRRTRERMAERGADVASDARVRAARRDGRAGARRTERTAGRDR